MGLGAHAVPPQVDQVHGQSHVVWGACDADHPVRVPTLSILLVAVTDANRGAADLPVDIQQMEVIKTSTRKQHPRSTHLVFIRY